VSEVTECQVTGTLAVLVLAGLSHCERHLAVPVQECQESHSQCQCMSLVVFVFFETPLLAMSCVNEVSRSRALSQTPQPRYLLLMMMHIFSIEIRKHSPFQAAAVGRNHSHTSDAHATSLLPPPSRSCKVFSLLFCAHINSPLNYHVCDISPS